MKKTGLLIFSSLFVLGAVTAAGSAQGNKAVRADDVSYYTKDGGFSTDLLETFDTLTLSDVSGYTEYGAGVDFTNGKMYWDISEENTTASVVYKFRQTINYQNSSKEVHWRLRKAGWEGIEIWHTDNQWRSLQMRTANWNNGTYKTAFAEEWGGANKFVSGTTYDITLGAIDIKNSTSVWVFYMIDDEIYLQGTFDKNDSSYSYATDYSENVIAVTTSSSLDIKLENADDMPAPTGAEAAYGENSSITWQNDETGKFVWVNNALKEEYPEQYSNYTAANSSAYVKFNGTKTKANALGVCQKKVFVNFGSNGLSSTELANGDTLEMGGLYFIENSSGFRYVNVSPIKLVYYNETWVNEADLLKYNKVDGKPATCEEAGYKDCYYCAYVAKYAEDPEGNTVIEDIDAWKAEGGAGYLAPLGHDYGTPVFTWTESGDSYEVTATVTCSHDATHTITKYCTVTSEVTKEATADEDGVKTYTATVTIDGVTYTDTKTVSIPKTGGGGEDEPDEPDDPSENTKKKGCGGSVATSSALIALVSLTGIAVIGKKRK